MKRLPFGIFAGLIAPFLFVFIFMLEPFLHPGYNSLTMFVSELSLGSYGWIQILNFIVFGFLLIIFSRAVASIFSERNLPRTGPVLLAVIGISYLLSGPFTTDPGTIFTAQESIHGIIHGIFGAIVFTLMPVVCFVFLKSFRTDEKLNSFQWITLVFATVITMAVVLLTIATKLPITAAMFNGWLGVIQRAAIIPFMLWVSLFALKLLRI